MKVLCRLCNYPASELNPPVDYDGWLYHESCAARQHATDRAIKAEWAEWNPIKEAWAVEYRP